jgi:CheY-like chemotaxis protein
MAGKHVLVIDDDSDVREALRLILEPRGYVLTFPPVPTVATRRARPPDVILLDIMLSTVSEGLLLVTSKGRTLARVPII